MHVAAEKLEYRCNKGVIPTDHYRKIGVLARTAEEVKTRSKSQLRPHSTSFLLISEFPSGVLPAPILHWLRSGSFLPPR